MNPLARFLAWVDEWYLARHPHGDGPIVRRINAWIDRQDWIR